jgi:tRNA (guanine10-N2)-dimethyltransferase
MPPKLARQMINLARTGESGSILDPFCGSGVTLLEGLSLGLKVAGSDNRDEAISQTRKNLAWFLESSNGGLQEENILFVERMDVRQLSAKLAPLSFDSIVAEGDLGPPIRGRLSRKAAVGFLPRLEQLYTAAFAEIRTVLKPGGRVSLAVPFWQPNQGDPIFLNLERKLRLIGYRPAILERGFEPITYRRKDQSVGRAIYVLESPL